MRHLERALGPLPRDTSTHRSTDDGGTASKDELAGLVEEARQGSSAAWEVLYRRAFPRLFAYARRRLPSDEHAHDAVSEAMVRAVAGIDRFANKGAGFDAWLYGILRHVVLDQHRRLWREEPQEAPEVGGQVLTPSELAEDRDDAARLRRAFGRLNATEQEILELRVVAGLSAAAVASVIGRRPGAVRMAQTRALARLRRLVREEDQGVA